MRNVTLIAVLILTVFAYAVRVIGAESSIVYSEDPQLIRQAMEIGQSISSTREFDTTFRENFKYPLTLTYYLAVVYGILYGAGRILLIFQSVVEFQTFLFENLSIVYVIAIFALNLISVSLVPIIFVLQRRLKHGNSGWLAAGLAAFNLLLVHFGHQPTPHVPLATLSLCAAGLLVVVAHNRGGWGILILATALSALVVGTLQSGILMCLPFALAILARPYHRGRYKWRRLLESQTVVSLIVFVGFCILLYPDIVGEYGTVILGYLTGQASEFNLGGGSHVFRLSMFSLENVPQFVFRLSSYQPFLTAILPFAFLYFVVSLWHRKKLLLICLPFPVLNLVIWSTFYGTFPRITVILVPFMIFAIAYAIEDFVCKVAARRNVGLGRLRVVTFFLLLAPAFLSSIRLVWVTAQTDTRSLMTDWIINSIEAEQTILLNFQLHELAPTPESIERQGMDFPDSVGTRWRWLATQEGASERRYNIYNAIYWNNLKDDPGARDEFLAEAEIRYLLVRSVVAWPGADDMIAYAQTHGKLVHVICPAHGGQIAELPSDMFVGAWQQIWKLHRPGPYVAIYDLDLPPDEPFVDVYCESG